MERMVKIISVIIFFPTKYKFSENIPKLTTNLNIYLRKFLSLATAALFII